MNRPTDTLVAGRPLTSCSSGDVTSPGAESWTDADLDALDAVHALQVEEIAYRATLQALERPFLAGLRRFLG